MLCKCFLCSRASERERERQRVAGEVEEGEGGTFEILDEITVVWFEYIINIKIIYHILLLYY